ncbi:MAG: hypothetical protein RR314_07470 [Oscillospiraceae bacterium]
MKICHLLSDVLNTNGSRGNVDCLALRLRLRGLGVEVSCLPMGGSLNPSDFDLIYLGAGHGEPSAALARELCRLGPELSAYAENGGVILAVCEGFELLGKTVTRADGVVLTCASVLDMCVTYGSERLTGDYSFDCGADIGRVVAFRNHAGRVSLGASLSPLGMTPEGEAEGARHKNVFGSYGHGPLLPKNPRLADAILQAALGDMPSALDDTLENAAHDFMERRLS